MATNNSVDVSLASQTGTGKFVGDTSPTLVTPTIGVASATSINFGGSALSNYVSTTSWTPAFNFVTPGNLSVAYTTQVGDYVRIGSLVFVSFTLVFAPTFTTSSGSALITGLPITIATTTTLGSVTFSGGVVFTSGYVNLSTTSGQTSLAMVRTITGTNFGNLATAAFPTGGTYTIIGSCTYFA